MRHDEASIPVEQDFPDFQYFYEGGSNANGNIANGEATPTAGNGKPSNRSGPLVRRRSHPINTVRPFYLQSLTTYSLLTKPYRKSAVIKIVQLNEPTGLDNEFI